MSDFLINEKKYFVANGKTFKKFIKEIEQSKNNFSNHDLVNKIVKDGVGKIRKEIDKNNGWDKLLNK